VLVQIWLVVFLGPLIAMAVIVGLVKGAQAFLTNETCMRIALSRPVAIISSVLFIGLALGLVIGLVLNPWLALFIAPFLLLNGVHVWSWLRRPRNLTDDADGERGSRGFTQSETEIWRR
jgi:hypothetical protein